MEKIINIGLIQQSCTADIQANKEKLSKNIAEVAQKGAQLVVLQELHNSLYFCQIESTDETQQRCHAFAGYAVARH